MKNLGVWAVLSDFYSHNNGIVPYFPNGMRRIWSAGLCTALVRTPFEFRHAQVVRTSHSL